MTFVPRNLAPFERYPEELAPLRVELGQLLDHHSPIAERAIGAGGQLFITDFWMMGVAQRSFHLLDGFLETFDSWNVTVAAPLLRLQLENLYRTTYIATAPDGADVVEQVMRGTRLRTLKAHDTRRPLTDGELVERAGAHFDWLPAVYEASNEWVHFSERHIFNAVRSAGDGEDADVIGRISLSPDRIPVGFLAELLQAMLEATLSISGLFESWMTWKLEHPSADPGRRDPVAGSPFDCDRR